MASITLINDLFANAHGIALLEESDFVVLNPGVPNPTGNRALISAGTGLGEAGLFADGRGGYLPFPSEGGHVDFAPRNDLEMDLLRYLMGRFEHVSYERVLSGPGLHNIYQFLRDTGRGRRAGLAGRADRAGRSFGRDLEIGAGRNIPYLRSGSGYFCVACMALKRAIWL